MTGGMGRVPEADDWSTGRCDEPTEVELICSRTWSRTNCKNWVMNWSLTEDPAVSQGGDDPEPDTGGLGVALLDEVTVAPRGGLPRPRLEMDVGAVAFTLDPRRVFGITLIN